MIRFHDILNRWLPTRRYEVVGSRSHYNGHQQWSWTYEPWKVIVKTRFPFLVEYHAKRIIRWRETGIVVGRVTKI